MSDHIEEHASRGTGQLFLAIKNTLELVNGLESRLIELERQVAEIQNGKKEPRFTLTENAPVAG